MRLYKQNPFRRIKIILITLFLINFIFIRNKILKSMFMLSTESQMFSYFWYRAWRSLPTRNLCGKYFWYMHYQPVAFNCYMFCLLLSAILYCFYCGYMLGIFPFIQYFNPFSWLAYLTYSPDCLSWLDLSYIWFDWGV